MNIFCVCSDSGQNKFCRSLVSFWEGMKELALVVKIFVDGSLPVCTVEEMESVLKGFRDLVSSCNKG